MTQQILLAVAENARIITIVAWSIIGTVVTSVVLSVILIDLEAQRMRFRG